MSPFFSAPRTRFSAFLAVPLAVAAAVGGITAGSVSAAEASTTGFDVVPQVSCQSLDGSDAFGRLVLVQFGYVNPNPDAVTVDYGSDNIVLQAPNFREGQPDVFQPGTHERVWSTHYSEGQEVSWYLQGAVATARLDDGSIPPCVAADLSVTTTAPASVASGSEMTYTVVVSNAGPSSAEQAALSSTLPYGTQFISVSTDRGSCTGPAPKTKGGTVTCALGTVAPDSSAGTQRIAVKITARPDQGVITGVVKTSSVTADPNLANNTATVQTVVRKR